jgi:hypothetical protein
MFDSFFPVHFLVRHVRPQSVHFQNQFPHTAAYFINKQTPPCLALKRLQIELTAPEANI